VPEEPDISEPEPDEDFPDDGLPSGNEDMVALGREGVEKIEADFKSIWGYDWQGGCYLWCWTNHNSFNRWQRIFR